MSESPDRVDALDERLVDLEVRLAFQDRAVTQLDEVVRALVAKLDALQRRVEELERAR
jgi:uncharacterized coiled-coil protein SlyX